MKAFHIHIHGLVQGVFFRKYTKEKAVSLGIKGTVRNCSDGSVEVFAEANEPELEDFIRWCHNGPISAQVRKVDIHDTTLKNFQDFVILKE